MGRPPSRPKRLKDGFYIEVRNKGANVGMRIHNEDEESMKQAAAFYTRTGKEVVILGEHRNDYWVNEDPNSDRNRKSALARKSARDRRRRAKNKNEDSFQETAPQKPVAKEVKKEVKKETPKKEAVKKAKATPPKAKKEKKAVKKPAKKAAKKVAKKPAKKKK